MKKLLFIFSILIFAFIFIFALPKSNIAQGYGYIPPNCSGSLYADNSCESSCSRNQVCAEVGTGTANPFQCCSLGFYGCELNSDCMGCRACDTSTGQCYDSNSLCTSNSTCIGGNCVNNCVRTQDSFAYSVCSGNNYSTNYYYNCNGSVYAWGGQTDNACGSGCDSRTGNLASTQCTSCDTSTNYYYACNGTTTAGGSQTDSNCSYLCNSCTFNRQYTQCGGDCGGTSYPSNHTLDVLEYNCTDGSNTYSCSDSGIVCGECGNSCSTPPTDTPTPTPADTCGQWYCDIPNTCNGGTNYREARQCTRSDGSVYYPTQCDTGQCPKTGCTPNSCEAASPSCNRCDTNGNWQQDFTCSSYANCTSTQSGCGSSCASDSECTTGWCNGGVCSNSCDTTPGECKVCVPPGPCTPNPSCSQFKAQVVDNNGNTIGAPVNGVDLASQTPVLTLTSPNYLVKLDASNIQQSSCIKVQDWIFNKDGAAFSSEGYDTTLDSANGMYCYDNPHSGTQSLYYPGYHDLFAYSGATPLTDLRISAQTGSWGNPLSCTTGNSGNSTICNSDIYGRNDCSTWEPGAQCSPTGHGTLGLGKPCPTQTGNPDTIDWSFQPNPQNFPRKYRGDGIIVYNFNQQVGSSDITVANIGTTCKIRVSVSNAVGGKVTSGSANGPGIQNVNILVSYLHNGVNNTVKLITDQWGKWSTDLVAAGDAWSVWPQCISGNSSMPYNAPINYSCDNYDVQNPVGPVASNSPHKTWNGAAPYNTTYKHYGDYYDQAYDGLPTGGSGAFDFYYIPTLPITGRVFIDSDRNGAKDTNESYYSGTPAGISVNLSGKYTDSKQPDSITGSYTFSGLSPGNYIVTLASIPTGWTATTTNPVDVTLTTLGRTVNFGIAPQYSVSGNIFVDSNKNGIKDASESNYTGNITITASSGTVATNNGSYTVSGLTPGTHTVSLNVPISYTPTYPQGVGSPSYSAVLPCTSTSLSPQSKNINPPCSGSNVVGADFGITNSFSWIQCRGGDCSDNNGFVNIIPQGASQACGGPNASTSNGSSSTTPGMIFTGDSNPDFGQGFPSLNLPNNWVVGGDVPLNFPEIFQPINSTVVRTSHGYMSTTAVQSGLTPTPLNSACNNSLGCSLSTLGHGLYSSNGDIYLNTSDLSCKNADGSNGNCVILINGTLHILGNISVPTGSTVTFTTSLDIKIDNKDVTSIQGFYSTDRNFYTGGNGGDCTKPADSALTINGALVVNAGLGGGSFVNERDLCGGNLNCPAVIFSERPDIILNAPDFIKHPTYIWHEAAP